MSEAIALLPLAARTLLEQLQMSFQSVDCSENKRPFLVGVSETTKQIVLLRPPCKKWSCPSCAARLANRWIARIIRYIDKNGHDDWWMFTLTAHEKWRGRTQSVRNLRGGWKRLYNRMRYEFGVKDYAKVWECHADGSFHLHGIIRNPNDTLFWLEDYPPIFPHMTQRWLKDNARSCGMGYQVDFHNVENAGMVAGYIAKYFMKSETVGDYPKNMRRIEVSHGWDKLPDLREKTVLTWHIQDTRDGQLTRAQSYYNRGFDIIDKVRGEL